MISSGLGVTTLAKSFHGDVTTVDASEHEITVDNADSDVGMAGIAGSRADKEGTKIGRALSKNSTVNSGENNPCESSLSAALSDVTTTLAGSRFLKVIVIGAGVVGMLAIITMVFTFTSKVISAVYKLYQDIVRPVKWLFRHNRQEKRNDTDPGPVADESGNGPRQKSSSIPDNQRTNESGNQTTSSIPDNQRTNESGNQRSSGDPGNHAPTSLGGAPEKRPQVAQY
jgi:hypothetical protein